MREIVSHTSMRGLAALGVVFYHLNLGMPHDFSPNQYTSFFKNAWVFVDLFFILSGFIMAMIYKKFLEEDISCKDLKGFFVHRFARIYPLHFMTLLFMICLSLAIQLRVNSPSIFDAQLLWNIIQNIFLIQAWGLSDRYVLNFPSWSISVEFAAYLLFPIFALYWRARLPVIAVVIVLCVYYMTLNLEFDGSLDVGERLNLLRGPPSFLLGMVIYHYRNITKIIPISLMTTFQVLSVIAIAGIMHFNYNEYLLIPAFASLVMFTWEDRGAVARTLCLSWLKSLGELSFSIYLLHIPVRNVGFDVWPKISRRFPSVLQSWGFNFSVIVVTIVLSAIVYRYFECPARDYLKGAFLKNEWFKRHGG